MARKIIPLKYMGSQNKKGSPFKTYDLNPFDNTYSGDYSNFEIAVNQLLDPGDIFGFRSGAESEKKVESKEDEFGRLKQDLIDTDVSMNFYKDIANPLAGMEDPFASLEDFSEDLTTNVRARRQEERALERGLGQALESAKQTGNVQSAQIIANQLAQASGDIAAKTAAEEYELGKIKAQSKQELGLRKAASKRELDMMKRKAGFDVEMQKIRGREDSLSRQLNKQQALLGLVSGELARADAEDADQFLGGLLSW